MRVLVGTPDAAPRTLTAMDRLRMILVLRGLLATFFVVLGVILVTSGDTVFGLFAIAVGITNAVLIGVLVRRARPRG